MASNAENVSIWWRHQIHVLLNCYELDPLNSIFVRFHTSQRFFNHEIASKMWSGEYQGFLFKPCYVRETDGPWRRHQMETFSVLLDIFARNSLVTGEFPSYRPEARSFDIFFDLRLNKWLSKQSWCWWFETPTGHKKLQLMHEAWL